MRGRISRARRAARVTELIQQVGRGNVGAFGDLFDATSPRVYGVALSLLRSPQLATEATEEIYGEVWRRSAAFDPSEANGLTWLMSMTHRYLADQVRATSAGPTSGPTGPTESEFDRVSGQGASWVDAELARRAVNSLSEQHRQVVTLAYFGGYNQREVARTLRLPLDTVKSRLREGLIALRDGMGVGA